MHELSIARDLVELVSQELGPAPVRVVTVCLRVGALSGVVPQALRFSFDAATAGTPLEGSMLEIEEVGPAVFCGRCRAERELADVASLCCPVCGGPTPNVIRGRELEVVSAEVADTAVGETSEPRPA